MKTLVLYYSWSKMGNTEKVAKYFAEKFSADIEKLIDKNERKGAIGWVMGGKKAAMKELIELEPLKSDLNQYDLIVVGGPVWSWNAGPVVRTFLTNYKLNGKKVINFCTMSSQGDNTCFETMKSLEGGNVQVLGEFCANAKEMLSGDYKAKMDDFIKKLNLN